MGDHEAYDPSVRFADTSPASLGRKDFHPPQHDFAAGAGS